MEFASEVIDEKTHATRLIVGSDSIEEQKFIYDGKDRVLSKNIYF